MKPLLPFLLTTLLLSACLSPSGGAPQTADGGTQTADGGLPTADYQTPASPTPTPTLTPTPTPAAVADFFDAGTFPAEMRQYVETLPARNNLDPSEAEQKAYIEQDRAFHQFYMREMVAYLRKNGVDTSEFKGFKGEDWLDYQKSIKVYEVLWNLLYEDYQKTGEYRTDWLLTPWLLRGNGDENLGMYDTRNFVPAIDGVNGDLGYNPGWWNSQEEIINTLFADNLQQAIQIWREKIKKNGFVVPIFGVPTKIERQAAVSASNGVLAAIADMPGRDGVKILILGFLDENGEWVYQPFAVNLSADTRTKPGDFMFREPNIVEPAPEGYRIYSVSDKQFYPQAYDEERLTGLLSHSVVLEANRVFFGENNNDIVFSVSMIDGIENVMYVLDGNTSELSPLNEQAGGQEEQEIQEDIGY